MTLVSSSKKARKYGLPLTLISLTLVAGLTYAIRFIFAGCCARAASGHVAAVPSAAMKSRRLIGPPEGMLPGHPKPNTLWQRGERESANESALDPAAQCPSWVKGGLR